MRRVVICFICATLMLSGCYSAKMVAPSDSDVKVLTETDNTEFKKEIRLWYVLFGAVPMSRPTDPLLWKMCQCKDRSETLWWMW